MTPADALRRDDAHRRRAARRRATSSARSSRASAPTSCVVDGDPLELDKLGDRIGGVWKDGVRVVDAA